MLDNEGYKHKEYVICSGFAWEQSLYERASVLHLKRIFPLVLAVLYCTVASVFVHEQLAKA
jgi:uncharacterized membrane protein YagU involved in acid resistance